MTEQDKAALKKLNKARAAQGLSAIEADIDYMRDGDRVASENLWCESNSLARMVKNFCRDSISLFCIAQRICSLSD